MGHYYALHDGEDGEVADAIRDHYKAQGPSDAVPTAPVSIAVALADKLDQLAGFFANDERPTGSGDPYALRRAALGIIRTVLDEQLSVSLGELCVLAFSRHNGIVKSLESGGNISGPVAAGVEQQLSYYRELRRYSLGKATTELAAPNPNFATTQANVAIEIVCNLVFELLGFLADRLKVALKEKGTRHDLIDAVFSLGNEDDLVRLVARVEALQAFLKTDDGANLLAGYKRAANILKAEEKKGDSFGGAVDAALLRELAEISLAEALTKAETAIAPALEKEDFAAAMRVMAGLRGPVDAFFTDVKVNADDAKLRVNRLNLLAALRALLHRVADFSKIEN
jgi:glycyl-tRNA synthetase beta chain